MCLFFASTGHASRSISSATITTQAHPPTNQATNHRPGGPTSHDSVLAAWADAMRTPSNAPYSASARQSVVAKPCERRKRGVVVREPSAEQDQMVSASRPGDEESARALQIKKVVRDRLEEEVQQRGRAPRGG